jgi:outer membrane lipoprotein LolB
VTASRIAACLWVAAVLATAGCAMAPLRPAADDPQKAFSERIEAMGAVDEWELRGRLAVRTRTRGESITMLWRRGGEEHYINLYGPMGAGRVILTRDAGGATLRDNEGKTYHDDSAEQLLYDVVGWRVPFRSLQHWVLGVVAPDSEYEMDLDQWGRPWRSRRTCAARTCSSSSRPARRPTTT